MKTIAKFWTSPLFENLTFRAAAYLLLVSNLLLPLGLHRLWMRIGGWWLFPLTFVVAGIGTLHFLSSHVAAWRMLVVPYVILFVLDSWILAVAPMPTGGQDK